MKAAFTHFIAKLHSAGLMREVYPPPEESSYNAEDMVSEGDAKVDVYNYAAQFGLIPRFSHRAVKRALFSTRGKMSHDYTVELPEQAIKVSARASTIEQAEIAASVHFKAAAEKYQAEHGDESIVINSSDALNTSNIKDFMRYYQFSIKGTRFDVSLKKDGKQRRGSNRWLAQATVNDEAVGEPVAMQNKKRAEDLAYLTCAVKLCNSEPKVMEGFRAAMRASGGSGFLEPVRPVGVQLDTNAVKAMEKTLRRCRAAGLTDRTSEVRAEKGEVQDTRQARMRRPLSGAQLNLKNKELTSRKRNFESDKSLAELRKKRAELPMTQYSDKVINLIKDNPYSIIIGATGSGKTTQVPQILLDHAIAEGNGAECNIICTQPRRIAATSVARRVAVERNEDLRESIGYHVRFDAKPPQLGGSINYCTTGILLQQLQHHPDDIYDTTSHIIIDEVHERDIPVDFLLVMLKKSMQARVDASRSVPKVTLMSATLDTELFASYFKRKGPDGQMMGCPSLSVPGRTFPVAEKYLGSIMEELGQTFSQGQLASMKREKETREFIDTEDRFVPLPPLPASFEATEEEDEVEATIDWKNQRIVSARGEVATGNEREEGLVPFALTAATIAHIARTSEGGAILVFLPGLDEIKKVDEYLRTESWLGINPRDTRKYKVFMLHSSLPESQTEVFDPVPPGCRKIILSTNIAETSVTIPDVQYVVDSGKLREKRYDQVRRITKLQCTWISKSNSKQRAGRAGRVQNGNYYALFSKQRFDSFRAIGLPEMLRSDLQEICLDIKSQAFQMPIRQFLAEAIEPPSPTAVEVSVRNLIGLQALTEEEDLTPLGRLLSSLPVHPSLGKMIVLGVIFRCLDSMLILGAAAAERPLWVMPMDKKREANAVRKEFAQDSNSDHIALINAYRSVRKIGHYGERHAFASSKFIHSGAFRAIEGTMEQIEEVLVTAGLITTTSKLARRDFQLGSPELNANSDDMAMIKSLAVAGLHPNLAISTGNVTFRTPGEKNVMVHGSSVNAVQGRRTRTESRPATRLLTYSTMLKNQDGSSYSLRDTSVTSPIMAILFGGKLHLEGNVMRMDKWLPFYVESSRDTVKTLWTFKNALDRVSLLHNHHTLRTISVMYHPSLTSFPTAAHNRLPRPPEFEVGTAQGYYLRGRPDPREIRLRPRRRSQNRPRHSHQQHPVRGRPHR